MTGSASLAGTLRLSILQPYVPTAGDCFEIVTAADRAGLFEIEDFEDLGAQLFFHDFVLESSLDLENWAEADTVSSMSVFPSFL